MRAKLTGLLLVGFLTACGAAGEVPDGWIDRIEGDVAVVVVEEGGRYRETVVPVAWLPNGAAEGDVVRDGALDPRQRAAVRERVEALQRRLLRRGDGTLPVEAPRRE